MSQDSRKVVRWASALATTAMLVVAILWWRQRQATGVSERPSAVAQSVATAKDGSAATAGPTSGRDWTRWADGVASFTGAEFQSLIEEALAGLAPAERSTILGEILAAWLKTDARSFNKYFMALEVANAAEKLDSIVAALKLALPRVAGDIARSPALQEIVRRFMAHFARNDPAEALSWATAWLTGDPLDSAFVQIIGPLAVRDAALARARVDDLKAPLRRMQALAAVGGNWAKGDAAAAASWAAEIAAPTERAMTMNAVLLTLAQTNSADAATRLAANARVMVDEYGVGYRNALAAANLTELDVANGSEAYRDLLHDGAVPPPNSPDVELMADAARVIAQKLAQDSPSTATAWAASLDNEFLRLNAMKGALSGWIAREPAAAINHYQAGYGRYHDILTSLYDTWTASDPVAASAGVALLQDQVHRTLATQSVARGWAAADAASAARWLDATPVGDRSDDARFAIVTALAPDHPVDAWNRALDIGDPKSQYRALKFAFGSLLTVEPAQARGLLQTTQLPETTTERLSEMLRAVD